MLECKAIEITEVIRKVDFPYNSSVKKQQYDLGSLKSSFFNYIDRLTLFYH